jgi:hypothetical protein
MASNWRNVEEGLSTLEDLKKKDALYPYNHWILVDGYSYVISYLGEKAYLPVGEICGSVLRYVTPEEFILSNSDYDIFTVDSSFGPGYIKIKVNKSDASWSNELFDVTWIGQFSTGNQLYVKAVLDSRQELKTPILEDFKVRVI